MLDPGLYNTPLIYQEATSTQSSVGTPLKTWVDITTVYGRVRTLSGREQFYAQTVNALSNVEITCRWHPAIKPTGRFKVVGSERLLNVISVADFENRRIELTVNCIEQVGD